MELWQVASMLGAHRPNPASQAPEDLTTADLHSAPMSREEKNRELARRRLAAARGEAPPVEAAAPADPAFLAQVSSTLKAG